MKSLITTKRLAFSKYVATGNDFIVIEDERFDPDRVKPFCNRRYGIGADGLLWIQPSKSADYKMVYYNSDGNRATMCLNGLRTLFFHTDARSIETDVGIYEGRGNEVILPPYQLVKQNLTVEGIIGDHYFTGVDHFVVEGLAHFSQAPLLRQKVGANVNCFEPKGDEAILVRTYEKGVEEETYSCGTGAYACYAKMGKERLTIHYYHGETLQFERVNQQVVMSGSVTKLFEGVL